ncbi:MAG: formylmethanofuran dehydrogenase subunit E family protein [Candidatus Bathyarchaeia archaeon]
METKTPKEDADFAKLLEKATNLHGHLGPFLVIGVRLSILAKRILNISDKEQSKLRVTVKLPLLTPYSCIIDGIQAVTQCTIGNQKLRIENSQSQISTYFKLQNLNEALKIDVNPKLVEELKSRFSKGVSNESLAREIASMPETQMFIVKKQ